MVDRVGKDASQPDLTLFADSTSETAHVSSVASMFLPARLTQARLLAGLTKRELAETVGVTPAAVGQWEAEVTKPRIDLIPQLARVLRVEPAFFAAGRPFSRVDTADAHFRSLRSMRASDRARALATIEQVWELVCSLERHLQLPEPNLPEVSRGTGPAEAARRLRFQWGQTRGPLRHLIATAESNGVVIGHADLDYIERVDAFSAVVAGRPIIMTTKRRSANVYDHRFSCAHELGHLLLHSDHEEDVELASTAHTRELEADTFAAELLTPSSEMRSVLPTRMDLGRLVQLSQGWGVDVRSLVRRMSELRMVSEATVRRAFVRLASMHGWPPLDPVHLHPGEKPQLLEEALKVVARLGVGPVELASSLHWSTRRIPELIGAPDPRPLLQIVPL